MAGRLPEGSLPGTVKYLPRVLLVFPGSVLLWLWSAAYALPAWWRDPESHWGPLGFLLGGFLGEILARQCPPPDFPHGGRGGAWILPAILVSLAEWIKPHAILHSTPALGLLALSASLMTVREAHRERIPPVKLIGVLGMLWLSLPWPAGPRAEVAGWLRSGILELTEDLLLVAGIASHSTGNVLITSASEVVVDQACSGIRSLQAVLGAAWFLAFWQLQSPVRRLVLVSAGLFGVWVTNACRAVGLVWMAHHQGIAQLQAHHDASGFWILTINSLLLGALTRTLQKGEPFPDPNKASCASNIPGRAFRNPAHSILLWMTWILLARESARILPSAQIAPSHAWQPRSNASVHVTPLDAARPESQMLYPSWAEELIWHDETNLIVRARGFHAVWLPGEVSNEFVGHHVPEVCLGNAGWEPQGEPILLPVIWKGRTYPFQVRRFEREGILIQVARLHLVDGEPRPQPIGNGRKDWATGLLWDLRHRGPRHQEVLLLHLFVAHADLAGQIQGLLLEASRSKSPLTPPSTTVPLAPHESPAR